MSKQDIHNSLCNDWETAANDDGMTKRLAVPGGWIYQTFTSVKSFTPDGYVEWNTQVTGVIFIPDPEWGLE